MNIDLPSYVKQVMNQLISSGYEAYLVGGAIRNHLMEYPIKDFDLTTNATPEQMTFVFKGYPIIPTGIQHGTLTVLSQGHPIEITTYRVDGEYKDHRHPQKVSFSTSLQEDCARRDFTINALCFNEEEGIIDFFQGKEDLKEKRIRCIGDPNQRFQEDALRILRALRFAARLDFSIEEKTAQAMRDQKSLLKYISKERIHSEITQLFSYPKSGGFLEEYFKIFEVAIPQLSSLNKELIFPAIQKEGLTQIARLSLLFSSLEQPLKVLKELTFSNKEIHQIISIIEHQDLAMVSDYDGYRILSVFGNIQDYLSYRVSLDSSLNYSELSTWLLHLSKQPIPLSLSELKFNGKDALELGYQGIEIKQLLESLLDLCMKEELVNLHSVLKEYAKKKRDSL